MVEQRCRGCGGEGGGVGATTCGRSVEDFSLSRAIVSGAEVVGAARRGGSIVTIVSR